MKTAEEFEKEWADVGSGRSPAFPLLSFIKRIQADALDHARDMITGNLPEDISRLWNESYDLTQSTWGWDKEDKKVSSDACLDTT